MLKNGGIIYSGRVDTTNIDCWEHGYLNNALNSIHTRKTYLFTSHGSYVTARLS